MSCVVIELLPDVLDRTSLGSLFDDTVIYEDSRIAHLTTALREEMNETDASAALAIEGVVLQIVATMLRVETRRDASAAVAASVPGCIARPLLRAAAHRRPCT
jgi:hypothetical protein